MRHKAFLSYYHQEGEKYKLEFERRFSGMTIPKSVDSGEIMPENSADYVKRLIREEHISDSSIVVVLASPNAWRRKHVDWEIHAALDSRSDGISGLVGVLLPEFPLTSDNKYNPNELPARLVDNIDSGYAELTTWALFAASPASVQRTLDASFARRKTAADRVVNSRLQLRRNL